MTSLHVDLNEAAKCIDIIPLLASLSHHIVSLLIAPSHSLTKYKMAKISGEDGLRTFINQVMKVVGIKIWKELTIGVQQLVKLLLTIILSILGLSFKFGDGATESTELKFLLHCGEKSHRSKPMDTCEEYMKVL